MGLSERRQKQRLVGSSVARNATWLNDQSLPGQRMLASMGWSAGSGLGSSMQGISSNLSLAIKLDNKGIGAHRHEKEAREQGKADAWVGAGGDLGSLFDKLNAANAETSAASEEEPKQKKQRIDPAPAEPRKPVSRLAHRARFRAAKQMVSSDADRMKEILGIKGDWIAPPAVTQETQPTSESKQDDSDEESESESEVESEVEIDAKESKKSKDKSKSKSKDKSKKKSKDKDEKKSTDKSKKKSKDKTKDKTKEKTKSKDKSKSKSKSKIKIKIKDDGNSAPDTNAEVDPTSTTVPLDQPVQFIKRNQFVFEYLSHKLILKRAEIARRKRDEIDGVWARTKAFGM
ncbi:hypothetical protein MCUN1_001810 [Malassezia cuniculi]|uniref:PinX1-related protein 1 n=1 Tax=Malassezia cuniculi TaxID=948313 RepID=A0AAF0J6U3_9BASI|nr:hypothetical protein MCUN1_001810 [Malassezia cuniculi]